MSFKRALLHVSLSNFRSFDQHYRELVSLAVTLVTESLTIHVFSPDIELYQDVPLSAWAQVHDLLGALYVCSAKVAHDNANPLLSVDVVFDKWCGYPVELCDDGQTTENDYDAFLGEVEDKSRLQEFNSNRKQSGLLELPIKLLVTKTPRVVAVYKDSSQHAENHNYSNTGIYNDVVVGGTFDHLHSGHKILLTMSVWITGKRLICGVTGENMLNKKKYKEFLEPLETRLARVTKFLNKIRPRIQYDVVPIYDIYGPTATDPNVDALVVSKETLASANSVNEMRKNNSLRTLDITVIEMISSTGIALDEKDLRLSSTYIREYISEKSSTLPSKK